MFESFLSGNTHGRVTRLNSHLYEMQLRETKVEAKKSIQEIGDCFIWKDYDFGNSTNELVKLGLKIGYNRSQHRGFGIVTLLNSSSIYLETIKVRIRCSHPGVKIIGDSDWNIDSINGNQARRLTFWFES